MTDRYALCELGKSPHGIGVFVQYSIGKLQSLPIWRRGDWRVWTPRTYEELRWCDKWCIYAWDKFYGPKDPYRMSLAWYVNHSSKPNLKSTYQKNGNWEFVANRSIKFGEELTINYATLDYYGK